MFFGFLPFILETRFIRAGILRHAWCFIGCWRASWGVLGSVSGNRQLSLYVLLDTELITYNTVIFRTYYVMTVVKRAHLTSTGFTTNVAFVVRTTQGWSRPMQSTAPHQIGEWILVSLSGFRFPLSGVYIYYALSSNFLCLCCSTRS